MTFRLHRKGRRFNPGRDLYFFILEKALLAQSGERATVNREVAGSKPARGVFNKLDYNLIN